MGRSRAPATGRMGLTFLSCSWRHFDSCGAFESGTTFSDGTRVTWGGRSITLEVEEATVMRGGTSAAASAFLGRRGDGL